MPFFFALKNANYVFQYILFKCIFPFQILEPPRFIQKPSPVVVLRKGQSTIFECQVAGTPKIHVAWYFDGNEVFDSDKYEISLVDNIATIKINNAMVEDSGTYICEARNDAGSKSCSTELKVKG